MIVVTFGTSPFPFHRAVTWLDRLLSSGIIAEPVILQHGSTPVSGLRHPLVSSYLSIPLGEMGDRLRRASLVISHAGQGSTRLLASLGVPFVLLPRLKRYREHIDDHQLLFAQAVSRLGVLYCTEYDELARYLCDRPAPMTKQLFEAPLLADHLLACYPR
ncbi:MAG: glucosyl transferase [Chloroflexaceae bacterium]|nr:glucosyl transferase [Chloroflexaceae bacterium]